jgi:hypothetical protein
MNEQWQPTRHGGVRRPRVAQSGRATSPGRADASAPDAEDRDTRSRSAVRIGPRGQFRFFWNEKLGVPGCEYLRRWGFETPFGSVRVHAWTGPDDDRAFHDHPWWFLTFVLKGGYWDFTPGDVEHVSAPAVRFRPALHRHTVKPYPGGAWTLLITGPKIRAWGFWVDGRFRKAIKYFSKYGHHPCD